MRKIKKPKFSRHPKIKRIERGWRRPRGSQSKLRKCKAGKGAKVKIGHGTPKSLRGLHPSGYSAVLVHNVHDLYSIDAKKQAAVIAAGVGKKLRSELLKAAKDKNIKILN